MKPEYLDCNGVDWAPVKAVNVVHLTDYETPNVELVRKCLKASIIRIIIIGLM